MDQGHATRGFGIDAESATIATLHMVNCESKAVNLVVVDYLPRFHEITFTGYRSD
jgi:hypothetical protein